MGFDKTLEAIVRPSNKSYTFEESCHSAINLSENAYYWSYLWEMDYSKVDEQPKKN